MKKPSKPSKLKSQKSPTPETSGEPQPSTAKPSSKASSKASSRPTGKDNSRKARKPSTQSALYSGQNARRAIIECFCEIVAPEQPVLFADGHDQAFIGIAFINHTAIAVYDQERTIEGIMEDSGMEHQDAEEYFDFNVAGAYVGQHAPAFMVPFATQLGWHDLDILIVYLKDNFKGFIQHTADFGYTKEDAKLITTRIVHTLATQAARNI